MSNWRGVVTLQDKGADTSTVTIHMDPAVIIDYADAVAAFNAYKPLLMAITDATIKSAYLAEDHTPDPADLLPVSGDYVSTKAHLQYVLGTNPAKLAYHDVPAPSQGIFKTASGVGSDLVDITDADVIAYNNWMVANAVISDGENIGAYNDGWKITRKSDRRN